MSKKIDDLLVILREAVRGEDVRDAMIECFQGIDDDADAVETAKTQAGTYANNAAKSQAAAAGSATDAQTANNGAKLAQTAAERAQTAAERAQSEAQAAQTKTEALKEEARGFRDEAAASAGSKTYSLYVDTDGDICYRYTPAS